LREEGHLDRARSMLQRAMALAPNLPSPYFDLGVVFLKAGQVGQALGQFEAALNLPAAPGRIPGLDLAISELRRALSDKPDRAEAHNVLGRLLGAAGADPQQVIGEFRKAIQLRPDYAEALNNLGLVYTQTGDDERAIASFREATRRRPDFADAHGNLGAVLTALDAVEAVRELEKAVELQPGLLRAQYNLALAYAASPNHGIDKQIEQMQKVLNVGGNYPRARFVLGKAFSQKGKPQDAIEHLLAAVKLEPNFGPAHYQLGLALSRVGRQQETADELQKRRDLVGAEQRQQSANLDMTEGKAALDRGDLDQAIGKFRNVIKTWPDAAEAHHQLGLALVRKGDKAGAIAALKKTLELDPVNAVAKETLESLSAASGKDDPHETEAIENYIREGKLEEVEPLLASYVGKRPDSSWGWYALGYCLFGQQKVGESIKALARSLQLDVNNAEAHKVLGRNLMIIGRFDAARIEFEQAARLNPESPEIHYNLGKLFSIQDDYPPAKRELEEAIRLDPSYIEAYDALGFALEALGDDAGAVANYERAIQLNESRGGTFVGGHVNLSAYYNRTQNAEKALEHARKATEINPKSDRAWFQMGKAFERLAGLPAAADALNRAISINPRASSYYYVLATVYRRIGKMQESRAAMESFTRLERETNEFEKKRRETNRNVEPVSARPDGAGHD